MQTSRFRDISAGPGKLPASKMKQSKLEMIWESALVLFTVAAVSAVVAVWANDNARQALRWERVEAERESVLAKRAEALSALVEGRVK